MPVYSGFMSAFAAAFGVAYWMKSAMGVLVFGETVT